MHVGPSPVALAAGEGAVWVLDATTGVQRVDAATGRPSGHPVPIQDPNGIAAGAGGVWVTSRGPHTVTRIDPDTLRADKPISVAAGPADVVTANGSVWVAEADAASVRRIDAKTGIASASLRVGDGQVLGLAATGDSVWAAVAENVRNTKLDLVRIDAETGKLDATRTTVTGGIPLELAARGEDVWLTDVGLDVPGSPARPPGVLHADAAGRVQRIVSVKGRPSAIATGPGAVWVTDSTKGTLTRLRVGN